MMLTTSIVLITVSFTFGLKLRFLRHADIDCRNGLFISHRMVYPFIGVSGSLDEPPSSDCIEHSFNQGQQSRIRFYRNFCQCNIVEKDNDSYVAHVHFGSWNKEKKIINWTIHDIVICPKNPVSPLSEVFMDVMETKKKTRSPYEYSINISSPLMSDKDSILRINFCKAYEENEETYFITHGICAALGEDVTLLGNDKNTIRMLYKSVTPVFSFVCRAALLPKLEKPSDFILKKNCRPDEIDTESKSSVENTSYDAGVTVRCKRSIKETSGQWERCSASKSFQQTDEPVIYENLSVTSQSYPNAVVQYLKETGKCSSANNAMVLIATSIGSFIIGALLPILILCIIHICSRRRKTHKLIRKGYK